jgi:protein-S-isoprenylcysteine O-methyltransferase Ste14
MNNESKSRAYGLAQSTLLCVFGALVFLDPERPMFGGKTAGAIGLALSIAGLLLMFAALQVIRGVIQIAPAPRDDGELVTRGVYSRFRHPIYTAIVILVIGLFLRKATPMVAAAGAVVIVFLLVKARFEETLLAARYPAYGAYRARTWGVIPPLGMSGGAPKPSQGDGFSL